MAQSDLYSVLGVPLEVTVGAEAAGSEDGSPDDCPPRWAEMAFGLAVALPQVRSVYWQAGPAGSTEAPSALPDIVEAFRRRFIT